MNHKASLFFCLIFLFAASRVFLEAGAAPRVLPGIDVIFKEENIGLLQGRRVGLITNHTAVDSTMRSSVDLFKEHAKKGGFKLAALFAPEHGLLGYAYASEEIEDSIDRDGVPVFSLHGKYRRPTAKMLEGIDLLVYDVQDVGSRSYTYTTTLFYAMEEAAKRGIPVYVLDRPNPINGLTIDGPMLQEQCRSMVGYINVPYCHGMTAGELAQFFNAEYRIGCHLRVIAMEGWRRNMNFQDTGMQWIPTSPYIPEASTALYYPTTGLIGELSLANIGIGFTLPFKLVGAPWIDAQKFAEALNAQRFSGVHFLPYHWRPMYGKFAREDCHGVLIVIADPIKFKPVSTQFLIIGILKNLYPHQFMEALRSAPPARRATFCKAIGSDEVYKVIAEEKNIVWKLRLMDDDRRQEFAEKRKKYLVPAYNATRG